MPERPRGIAAVVVNYNARDYLIECVRSLRAEGIEEVVVVDNDSHDGSREALARADAAARFLPAGGNLGFGAAANRGVAATTGDFVAIMNPDLIVEPGALKALADALDGCAEVAIVGPLVENPDGSIYPSVRTFPSLGDAIGHGFLGFLMPRNRFSRRYRMLDWDHSAAAEVDWVPGTLMLVRRTAFEALGGFDEGYFMYVEDVDLCWRAWRSGWRVAYEPAARVVHVIGVSSDLAPYRMILAHHRSLWRFATRSAGPRRRVILPLVAVGLAVRTLLAWVQRAARRRPHAAP